MITALALTSFAAEPEIAYEGSAFVPRGAIAEMSKERPGILTVMVTEAPASCDTAAKKKAAKKRVLILGFPTTDLGTASTEAWAMIPQHNADVDWTGAATIAAMPPNEGGIGRIVLAFTGPATHATGDVAFTLCTPVVPYVAPSSAWTVQQVTLESQFMDERTKVDVRMPFPSEWEKVEMGGMGPAYVAQDARTNLSFSLGEPPADPTAEFKTWADGQIAAFNSQGTHVAEIARTAEDGVYTLRWTAGFDGQPDAEHVDVFVAPAGVAKQIHCSASGPVGLSIYDDIAKACAQITAP